MPLTHSSYLDITSRRHMTVFMAVMCVLCARVTALCVSDTGLLPESSEYFCSQGMFL